MPSGLPAAIAAYLPRPRPARRAAAVFLFAALLHHAYADAASSIAYPEVERGHVIEFPRDEGAHPEFRTEWWYVTGWLETEQADSLGFQITFFRSRPGVDEENPSRFAARQLLFAHVAISDPKRGVLVRDEKSAREGFGLAAAKRGDLDVHIDDWVLRRNGDRYIASIQAREFALELALLRTQPPLLQGDRGFSQKGPEVESASYYYSLPQLATTGRIAIDGREHRVTGVAWFDHEWSSSIMDEAASGWDWVGLNLDDGGALMAFRMRNEAGEEHWAAATFRSAGNGAPVHEVYRSEQVAWRPQRYWRSARTGVRYPIEWKILIGERTITLEPLMDDQENDARGSTGTLYWEGAVRALDEQGQTIGRGYLELTGYGSRLRF